MNKVYKADKQGRDWDFDGLMAMAATFVSNGGTPGDSVTTKVKGLPDIDLLGDNTHPGVTNRIDALSPHPGYDGDLPRSGGPPKRPAPERSPSPRCVKRRKLNPPPKVPPDSGPSTSFPPAHPSEGYELSRGGRKSKAEPLSKMRDYYYRQNTSPDDQTYFNDAIERLRGASYLGDPQTHEPTISSELGQALLRVVRVEGPGRAKEDESVYAVFVDKPSSGPFRCWICGHLEKQRKALRVLGHVREHFEHRPWVCTQDHRTGSVKDEKGILKRRRASGRDGPW